MRLSTVGLSILAVFALVASVSIPRGFNSNAKRTVAAVVAGQPIYEDELLPLIEGQLKQLRNQEYELKSSALEKLVDQKLLQAEARKEGISVSKLMEQEVDAKVPEPSESELKAAYLSEENSPNHLFDQIKPQLQQALKQEKLQEARRNYLERLRNQAGVSVLLPPPRVEVAYDRARLRGSP